MDECRAAVADGAVGAAADNPLDRVAAGVAKLWECSDDSCVDSTIEVLWQDLSEATESAAIVAGQPDETARLDQLLARIDECQAAVAGSAVAGVEHAGDDGAAMIATEIADVEPPQVATEASSAEAVAETADAVEAPTVVAQAATTGVATGTTSKPTPSARPKRGRALKRYYVLRAIEPTAADQHLNKLVRLTLSDGRRVHDQLVAVQNGSLVLKRDKAAGGTRYAIKLELIERLEVFGL